VALSLVGEPIFYPKINEMINEYHKRHLSTFLVTNAQFPEQLKKILQEFVNYIYQLMHQQKMIYKKLIVLYLKTFGKDFKNVLRY